MKPKQAPTGHKEDEALDKDGSGPKIDHKQQTILGEKLPIGLHHHHCTSDQVDDGSTLRRRRATKNEKPGRVNKTKFIPSEGPETDMLNYQDDICQEELCTSSSRSNEPLLGFGRGVNLDDDNHKRNSAKSSTSPDEPRLIEAATTNSAAPLLEDVSLLSDNDNCDNISLGLSSLCSSKESGLQTATQIFIPFIIAGCGTVGAGMVLDSVQHWQVFKEIDEIYILLPALLGLKGNLEMTLASRLSTHANLGDMNSRERRLMVASGNIALTQCQASIVSLLACILAFSINFIYTAGQFNLNNIILITAAALLTSAIASLLLGLLMILVVFLAQAYNINPDNIATPIAASLGDLVTLSLYAFLTNSFYNVSQLNQLDWFSLAIICTFIILIPVWAALTRTNKYTSDILYNGWTPILAAMMISSISGVILNVAVSQFTGIAVFHPVICGVGGNLVAVQASRLSTHLHKTSPFGLLPASEANIQFNPISVIFGRNPNSKTARLLMAMAIPGHLFFAFIIATFESGHLRITPTFLMLYSMAAELQIVILLYLAYILTCFMWSKSIDPDNSSIPYLTAFGDFFGTTFLWCAFMILHSIRDDDVIRS